MITANVILRLISFTALFCVAGCATGPTFTPVDNVPEGKAVIYVYRMFNVGGVASSHRIYANGELVADFENASHCPFIVLLARLISPQSQIPSVRSLI